MVICIIDSREFLLFNIDYWEIENESRGDYVPGKRCCSGEWCRIAALTR